MMYNHIVEMHYMSHLHDVIKWVVNKCIFRYVVRTDHLMSSLEPKGHCSFHYNNQLRYKLREQMTTRCRILSGSM